MVKHDAEGPSYTVASKRSSIRLFDIPEISVPALGENVRHTTRHKLRGDAGLVEVWLWSMLVATIAVLGFFTLKLARRDDAPVDG